MKTSRPRLPVTVMSSAISAAVPVLGANFLVDTTVVDLGDIAQGDGKCECATFPPANQRCTLRAAVQEANALPGMDTIIMAGPAVEIQAGADHAFRTRGEVVLRNGFTVRENATFTVVRDPAAGSSVGLP